jgi:hypothetical protein
MISALNTFELESFDGCKVRWQHTWYVYRARITNPHPASRHEPLWYFISRVPLCTSPLASHFLARPPTLDFLFHFRQNESSVLTYVDQMMSTIEEMDPSIGRASSIIRRSCVITIFLICLTFITHETADGYRLVYDRECPFELRVQVRW